MFLTVCLSPAHVAAPTPPLPPPPESTLTRLSHTRITDGKELTSGGRNEGGDGGETLNTLHLQKKKTLFSASTSASALPCVRACGGKREEGGVVRPVLEWVCGETCPSARSRGRRSLPGVGVQTKETNTLTLDLWSPRRRGRRESESRGLRGVFCRIRGAHVFVSCAHWCVRDVCVGAATPTRCCVDD